MKNSLNIWLQAIRPKTLPAAVAPVMIGTAMAYADGFAHYPSAFAALIGALAIQILTNLANDYFDFKKGADTQERIGPTRVMQAGLVSDGNMKSAMFITAGIAVLASFYLITRAGWPILLIGVISIVSGIFYTAGPRPLGYLGLGDIFVLYHDCQLYSACPLCFVGRVLFFPFSVRDCLFEHSRHKNSPDQSRRPFA